MDKEKISAAPVDEGQVPDIENKEMNYAAKVLIVEELKQLLEKAEDVSGTFQAFRELQGRWKSIGVVPQAKVKDLLESYQYYVEKFYDYIKINKEFRDMDFRKNREAKEALCIKAEELAQQENSRNFRNSMSSGRRQGRWPRSTGSRCGRGSRLQLLQ